MADIKKATIGRTNEDGVVDFIYPKTSADVVVYDENSNDSVKAVIANLVETKMDKVEGATLTTNDFTDEYKNKLDSIEEGANKITVDKNISARSTNPVENRAIKEYIDDLENRLDVNTIGDNIVSNTADINALKSRVNNLESSKVDTVEGKGLSSLDFTETYANKIDNIETTIRNTAVMSVQGESGEIKQGNVYLTKEDFGLENVDNTADADKRVSYATTAGNSATVNSHTVNADVPSNAKFTDTTYNKANAVYDGLMSKEDYSKLSNIETGATKVIVDTELISDSNNAISNAAVVAELSNKIDSTEKGAAGGVATLDSNRKVPASQLPSFVDDTVEGRCIVPATGDPYFVDTENNKINTPETGKIYVCTDTNKTFRWSGSRYVEISASLALGNDASTAFPGDLGTIAYNHSQDITTNPHKITQTTIGLDKVANKSPSEIVSENVTKDYIDNLFNNQIVTADQLPTAITVDDPDPKAPEGLVTRSDLALLHEIDERTLATGNVSSVKGENGNAKTGNVVLKRSDFNIAIEGVDNTDYVMIEDEETGELINSGEKVSKIRDNSNLVPNYLINNMKTDLQNQITSNDTDIADIYRELNRRVIQKNTDDSNTRYNSDGTVEAGQRLKVLSDNNFTDTYKTQLDNEDSTIKSTIDTYINGAISGIIHNNLNRNNLVYTNNNGKLVSHDISTDGTNMSFPQDIDLYFEGINIFNNTDSIINTAQLLKLGGINTSNSDLDWHKNLTIQEQIDSVYYTSTSLVPSVNNIEDAVFNDGLFGICNDQLDGNYDNAGTHYYSTNIPQFRDSDGIKISVLFLGGICIRTNDRLVLDITIDSGSVISMPMNISSAVDGIDTDAMTILNMVVKDSELYATVSGFSATSTYSYYSYAISSGTDTSGGVSVGSNKKPVYFLNGRPKELGYTIEKSVPSNAVFTDTHHVTTMYLTNKANAESSTKITSNTNTTNDNKPTILVQDTYTNSSGVSSITKYNIKVYGLDNDIIRVSTSGSELRIGTINDITYNTTTNMVDINNLSTNTLSSTDFTTAHLSAEDANIAYTLTFNSGSKINTGVLSNNNVISLTMQDLASLEGMGSYNLGSITEDFNEVWHDLNIASNAACGGSLFGSVTSYEDDGNTLIFNVSIPAFNDITPTNGMIVYVYFTNKGLEYTNTSPYKENLIHITEVNSEYVVYVNAVDTAGQSLHDNIGGGAIIPFILYDDKLCMLVSGYSDYSAESGVANTALYDIHGKDIDSYIRSASMNTLTGVLTLTNGASTSSTYNVWRPITTDLTISSSNDINALSARAGKILNDKITKINNFTKGIAENAASSLSSIDTTNINRITTTTHGGIIDNDSSPMTAIASVTSDNTIKVAYHFTCTSDANASTKQLTWTNSSTTSMPEPFEGMQISVYFVYGNSYLNTTYLKYSNYSYPIAKRRNNQSTLQTNNWCWFAPGIYQFIYTGQMFYLIDEARSDIIEFTGGGTINDAFLSTNSTMIKLGNGVLKEQEIDNWYTTFIGSGQEIYDYVYDHLARYGDAATLNSSLKNVADFQNCTLSSSCIDNTFKDIIFYNDPLNYPIIDSRSSTIATYRFINCVFFIADYNNADTTSDTRFLFGRNNANYIFENCQFLYICKAGAGLTNCYIIKQGDYTRNGTSYNALNNGTIMGDIKFINCNFRETGHTNRTRIVDVCDCNLVIDGCHFDTAYIQKHINRDATRQYTRITNNIFGYKATGSLTDTNIKEKVSDAVKNSNPQNTIMISNNTFMDTYGPNIAAECNMGSICCNMYYDTASVSYITGHKPADYGNNRNDTNYLGR